VNRKFANASSSREKKNRAVRGGEGKVHSPVKDKEGSHELSTRRGGLLLEERHRFGKVTGSYKENLLR